jgi:HEAT repeat protein
LRLVADPLLRDETLHAVSGNADDLAVELVACAGGRNAAQSIAAFQVLELAAPPAAAPGLARLLSDRRRRAAAARCLARIDTVESAAALIAAARHPRVREAFALAGPVMEEQLLERLASGSTLVRGETVDLLGRCGGPRTVAMLVPLAEDPALAPRVLSALSRIGGESGIAALDVLAGRPRLARSALAALGDTGAEEAVEPIVRHGLDDPRLRGPALRALSRIPSELAAHGAALLESGRSPRAPLARGGASRTRSTSIF